MDQIINKAPKFYRTYIKAILSEMDETARSVPAALAYSFEQAFDLFSILHEEQKDYAYADGKWTVAEVIGHVIDAERIFAYRALRIARGDKGNQPGWDENEFASVANYNTRSLDSLKQELLATFESTGHMFAHFSDDMYKNTGIANGLQMDVETIGYITAGHRQHHWSVIKNNYLSNQSIKE